MRLSKYSCLFTGCYRTYQTYSVNSHSSIPFLGKFLAFLSNLDRHKCKCGKNVCSETNASLTSFRTNRKRSLGQEDVISLLTKFETIFLTEPTNEIHYILHLTSKPTKSSDPKRKKLEQSLSKGSKKVHRIVLTQVEFVSMIKRIE